MTDHIDDACDREEQIRADALRDQALRAGIDGKTAADSALFCIECGDDIPEKRRKAVPGCERCVSCMAVYERTKKRWGLQ
ncbi:TraR/DksA family transcriptional regulator [Diaphorobacter sp. HDW4A]|uniref:TraR/DksA C4-type zinc finger protein n=1 Tax=Diaphorobacter sp. HDW4A TaxID=2714924 RepID=UPI00140D0A70|nr:TraR/DksA C4-type zinc finger protein [Diaphorobacter sp. HDW4A]QIL81757.1 TraR/DksA family transcriptional regulator [Diaphorobacter sp. HDW4A]